MKHREKVDALLMLTTSRARIQHVIDVTYRPGECDTEHRRLLMQAQNETRDLFMLLRNEVRDAKVKR
jgi:hypothetical protein